MYVYTYHIPLENTRSIWRNKWAIRRRIQCVYMFITVRGKIHSVRDDINQRYLGIPWQFFFSVQFVGENSTRSMWRYKYAIRTLTSAFSHARNSDFIKALTLFPAPPFRPPSGVLCPSRILPMESLMYSVTNYVCILHMCIPSRTACIYTYIIYAPFQVRANGVLDVFYHELRMYITYVHSVTDIMYEYI